MASRRRPANPDVFINVPFDRAYENLFLSLIAGLAGLGLNPRCALEVLTSTDQLRRVYGILASCPFSLHDLSRVQMSRSGPFRVPRLNMAFELGMAAAVGLAHNSRHQWRVMESVSYRLNHSLGDIAGYDAYIHGGTADGMLSVLLDIFVDVTDPLLGDIEDLRWVFRRLRRFREPLTANVYRPNAFRKLVLTAHGLTLERLQGS